MRGVRVVVLDVRKGDWEGEVGGEFSSGRLFFVKREQRVEGSPTDCFFLFVSMVVGRT